MKRVISILVMLAILPWHRAYSTNTEWDKIRFQGLPAGKKYNVSMGSGFFINSNNIVTNRHVVTNCKNIAIRGAVKPTKATLVVVDKNLDLAILYSPASPAKVPYLRINYDQISKNDILFTVGYPLKYSEIGEFLIRDAQVLDTKGNPNHGFSSISFTDVVDHGNSGGPLLDKNSNIVGVVTAEISYFKDEAETQLDHTIGVAIGLDGLIDFLNRNNASFASNSSYDIFTNYNPEKIVRDYVVNIHCISDIEEEPG
jgi:S1-C subfamily serine protease